MYHIHLNNDDTHNRESGIMTVFQLSTLKGVVLCKCFILTTTIMIGTNGSKMSLAPHHFKYTSALK